MKFGEPRQVGGQNDYLTEVGSGVELDIRMLVFRQIERINLAASFMQNLNFAEAVNTLENMLCYKHDEIYKKEIKKNQTAIAQTLKTIHGKSRDDYDTRISELNSQANIRFAELKYQCLMRLLSRKNFLPADEGEI